MQAAGLLKDRLTHDPGGTNARRVKAHRPMAKPVLVATITQDNSNVATVIKESSDGMRWITTRVKVGHVPKRVMQAVTSFSHIKSRDI